MQSNLFKSALFFKANDLIENIKIVKPEEFCQNPRSWNGEDKYFQKLIAFFQFGKTKFLSFEYIFSACSLFGFLVSPI